MIILLTVLTLSLIIYSIGFWSTKIYPTVRPYRYNPSTDVYISSPQQTMLHKTMANQYQLQHRIANSLTDAEQIEQLVSWVHSLWQPQPGRSAKSNNPLTIISRAQNGEKFSRDDYCIVLANAMMAVGIPTRLTTLCTRDAAWRPLANTLPGIEYFDREHLKWVWLDGRFGVRLIQENKPLNVLEIKEAMLSDQIMFLHPDAVEIDVEQYLKSLAPFMDILIAHPMGQSKSFALIPPQLKFIKYRFLFGKKIYDISCHSVLSYYATYPIKQLTKPRIKQVVSKKIEHATHLKNK